MPASNAAVTETYDRVAGLYERLLAPVERPSQRAALRALSETVDLAGARVVEVGCGPGGLLGDLRGYVGADGGVVGVDAAPGMVETARGRGGAVVLGDARRLPLADGSVDAVCALDVLELFSTDDLERVLAEVRRVLRPEGRLCAVTMVAGDVPDSRFLRAYEWVYRSLPGAGRVGCRPIDLDGALDDAGFTVERTTASVRAGVWPVVGRVARL